MSSLRFIRLSTLVLAVSYSLAYAPDAWRYVVHPNAELAAFRGSEASWVTAGVIGLYVTAAASVIFAYAIPRWPAGVVALSWCFLLMGLSLLNHWVVIALMKYGSAFMQLSAFAWTWVFALPPLILAALLRQRCIQQSLYARDDADRNV
jgi:hypothetical protein